ncbi:hypothetical protein O3G_MSEX009505 [Manduca sexta]|uniref:Cuticle protein n=1 Tax=Manduca sexta TaxID=7130 RepID=A0A921ZEB0_MANSE|nr:hypothetical protein O3G_MSEX009505 [Manduca sexta]KAG6455986.1 hypothetical protein O3G_MSEX009505 [Manduca sexta]
MKFFTPLTAIIAAASAGQILTNQRAENYDNAAQIYQSALEYQQHGLYSNQPQTFAADAPYHSRPAAEKTAKILSFILENDGHGYQYAYETENGIKVQEAGVGQGKGHTAQGAYSYTGDDGHEYSVSYMADEHGFRVQGAHLPTPPPVPEVIAKALEQNARDEAAGVYDDGHYEEPMYSSSYEHASPPAPAAAPASVYHHK